MRALYQSQIIIIDDEDLITIEDDECDAGVQPPPETPSSYKPSTSPLKISSTCINHGQASRSKKQVQDSKELARSDWQFSDVMVTPSNKHKPKSINADLVDLTEDNCDGFTHLRLSKQFHEIRQRNGEALYSLNISETPHSIEDGLIISLDDEDMEDTEDPAAQSALTRSLVRQPEGLAEELIDLDCLEAAEIQSSGEPDIQLLHVSDVFLQDLTERHPRKPSNFIYNQRNPGIVPPFKSLDHYRYNGMLLRQSKVLELRDGDFLRTKDIIYNEHTHEVTLRGHRLQRSKDLNGTLEKKLNEVCLSYEIDADDPRVPDEQSVVEVALTEVHRIRLLRMTNQIFPNCRQDINSQFLNKTEASIEGWLTARWKYTCTYASAWDRHRNIWRERALEHFKENESMENYKVADAARRVEWRGETIPGGTFLPMSHGEEESRPPLELDSIIRRRNTGSNKVLSSVGPRELPRKRRLSSIRDGYHSSSATPLKKSCSQHHPSKVTLERTNAKISTVVVDLTEPPPMGTIFSTPSSAQGLISRLAGQTLTYGDAFCGAGGASRGAHLAGLRVTWGFDFWNHACETWKANFPWAKCYNISCHEFAIHGDDVKVDILHVSPPCQFFSPAHTVHGKDDEMNVASLFGVCAVIKKAKPRVVTLEQTFGIGTPKFRYYFNALIHQFSSLNFSVRWAIIPLANWGLPQRRHRLIIIASCPGEILPKIPAFTHSENGEGGLKPFASVNQTLARIPPNAPDHNPDEMPRFSRTPWDGHKIVPRAITCHGGLNHHPSGKRDFTLREYACLQGFPHNHVFRGCGVKKQIGNAVPSCIAKVLFRSIKKDLDEADGVVAAPRTMV